MSNSEKNIKKTLYLSITKKKNCTVTSNIEVLENTVLKEIYQESKYKKTIAFFFAHKGFSKHFGNLEFELKK